MGQVGVAFLSSRWLAASIMRAIVEADGHCFVRARRWSEVRRLIEEGAAQFVVFDCPRPCGMHFLHCGRLSAETGVPFIVISRDQQPAVRLEALQAGALEYIADPFYPEELLARMRLHLGRANRAAGAARGTSDFLDLAPGLQLDLAQGDLVHRGMHIQLNPTELKLLSFMVAHEGRVIGADALIAAVWGSYAGKGPQDLYTYIRSLREKLGDTPAAPRFIRNRYGRGYVFAREPMEPAEPEGGDPERVCGMCEE